MKFLHPKNFILFETEKLFMLEENSEKWEFYGDKKAVKHLAALRSFLLSGIDLWSAADAGGPYTLEKLSIISTISAPMRFWASLVAAPIWGVQEMAGWSRRALFMGGSSA